MQSKYNMSNQQLQTTDQQQDLGIIISKDLSEKTNREKLQNGQWSTGVLWPQFQVQRTDRPIIQIPSPPTSRTRYLIQTLIK